MKKTLLFFAALLVCATVFAENYAVGKAAGMKIDGILDEAAWSAAPVAGNFKISQKWGKKDAPKNKTEFRVLCDDKNVYFGITCYEPGKIVANLPKEWHSNPWLDDVVEIFLCPNGQPSEFYQFVISAGGAHWEQYWGERGEISPDPYAPAYEYATKVFPDKWVAEVRIPYTAFYLTSATQWKNVWRANIARLARTNYQNSTWSALRKDNFDSEAFNTLSGLTAKPKAYDLYVQDARFKMTQRVGSTGIGTIAAEITAYNDVPTGEKHTIWVDFSVMEGYFTPGRNTISWKNCTMKQMGKTKVHFTIKNSKGEVVHERDFPLQVDFNDQVVTFTSPQFSETFFPGENPTTLRGTVELVIPQKEITVTVAGKEHKFPVKNNRADFNVDLTGLSFPIDVQIGTYKTQILKSDDAKAWIRDGKVWLNGKPTILLGWYGGDGWIMSKACKEQYPTPEAKGPFNTTTWMTLEVPRVLGTEKIEKEEMVFDREPSQKVYDAIRQKIENVRNGNFFIYYLCDEPECRGISPVYLRYLYKFIRRQDPTRLVMIVSREPVRYLECADIISPHKYIQPDIDDKGVRTLTTSVRLVRDTCSQVGDLNRMDKILMFTPQVCSYSFNDYYADYPNFDESRASCWSCFIRGGQGIYPYVYYDHFSRPTLRHGYTEIYETLYRLNPWLAGGKYKHLSVTNGDGAIFSRDEKSRLIALVNLDPTKQTITAAGLPDGNYFRVREEGTVEVKNGKLSMVFEPYQVLLLTTEKCDEGLKPLADVRKQIADDEYARTHRGNILHGRARKIAVDYPESRPYNTQGTMEQQDKMFDGCLDVSAWQPRGITGDLWYELSFTSFTPKFSKARVHGNALKGLTFKIWKFGKWVTPEVKVTEGKYYVELDFGKTLSTVKIHLDFVKSNDLELYEIELLK